MTSKPKNQITIFVSDDLLGVLEKRAKKNMQSVNEQIEEILRKSCVTYKGSKSVQNEKLDDVLIGLFSRRNTGRKPKR